LNWRVPGCSTTAFWFWGGANNPEGEFDMSAIKIGSSLAAALFVFGFLQTGRTQAEEGTNNTSISLAGTTVNISGSLSGTTLEVPFDFDKDRSTGTGTSGQATAAGTQSVGGAFTAQAISEADAKSGTGCSRAPTMQAGCSIDGVTNGCLYTLVGGVGALRFNSDGDISSIQVTGGTQCVDYNSTHGFAPPFNFTISENISFTGGTGEFAGTTGGGTLTGTGRILGTDAGGHAFSWFQARYTALMTMP
jgi:hypothetical protein